MSDLTEKSNRLFKGLCKKKLITEKELKYFSFNFKNACCLGKMYLLRNIHKRLFDVPGRPVISDCGTPAEKVSECSDHHLQPVMKGGTSYVKGTQDLLEKLKHLGKVPSNAILVAADVVGLSTQASLMRQVWKLCIRSWRKEWKRKFHLQIYLYG